MALRNMNEVSAWRKSIDESDDDAFALSSKIDNSLDTNGDSISFVMLIWLVEGCRITSIIACAIPNFPLFVLHLFSWAHKYDTALGSEKLIGTFFFAPSDSFRDSTGLTLSGSTGFKIEIDIIVLIARA